MIALTDDADDQEGRHARRVWYASYLLVVGFGLVIALYARRRFDVPYLGVSLAVVMVMVGGWIVWPRATLYTTLFLTAVSDYVTVWWFPFVKNLSSRESISYLADAATVSPLEVALATGAAVSVLRRYARTGVPIAPTPLNRTLYVFLFFVAYGFARGLYGGGDLRIAVLEGRALFYITLAFVIVVNECTDDAHLRAALWSLLAGVTAQALLTIEYLGRIDPAVRDQLESLNEHGSAIGYNLLLVTFLALLWFRVRVRLLRWALFAALIPVTYVYLVAQRRAGVAALVVAGALIAIALFWRQRRMFWAVTPLATIVITVYLVAFWSSTSSLGFPAQAIKTVIAPGSATEKDRSSDLYRLIETLNVNFTIRADPIKGLGFGRPFFRPFHLPETTAFDLSAYTPHNSILWFWIKTGFFGFVAMLYLFAKSMMLGARRIREMAHGLDLVVTVAAVSFIMMFAIFSWVDISWDARNCVFLGLALAICARPPAIVDGSDPEAVVERQETLTESTTPARVSA